ncbi:MAG: hypothetical protein JNN25_08515 [Candidatus Kapabacteria bacterium]|nr:hypothetical protein [Candidatus Kapabacteria bacterium]
MKRTDIFVIAICSIAVLATSCSQGTLATNKTSYYGAERITSSDVDYIERLVKGRFLTPLSPNVNLRHEIRMYAQQILHSGNQDIRVLHDDIFWLNWAANKYPANMSMNTPSRGIENSSDSPFGRINN